jgi:hypothetical protein
MFRRDCRPTGRGDWTRRPLAITSDSLPEGSDAVHCILERLARGELDCFGGSDLDLRTPSCYPVRVSPVCTVFTHSSRAAARASASFCVLVPGGREISRPWLPPFFLAARRPFDNYQSTNRIQWLRYAPFSVAQIRRAPQAAAPPGTPSPSHRRGPYRGRRN